jgi:hypothetical protein
MAVCLICYHSAFYLPIHCFAFTEEMRNNNNFEQRILFYVFHSHGKWIEKPTLTILYCKNGSYRLWFYNILLNDVGS